MELQELVCGSGFMLKDTLACRLQGPGVVPHTFISTSGTELPERQIKASLSKTTNFQNTSETAFSVYPWAEVVASTQ